MIIKLPIFRDKIFIIAIIFSVVWHIFWLSIVTVVITPEAKAPVRFSRVSFLGPLLGRGVIEARLMPKERSFLEERYLESVEGMFTANQNVGSMPSGETYAERYEKRLTPLIEEALDGSKLEAPYHSMEQ